MYYRVKTKLFSKLPALLLDETQQINATYSFLTTYNRYLRTVERSTLFCCDNS